MHKINQNGGSKRLAAAEQKPSIERSGKYSGYVLKMDTKAEMKQAHGVNELKMDSLCAEIVTDDYATKMKNKVHTTIFGELMLQTDANLAGETTAEATVLKMGTVSKAGGTPKIGEMASATTKSGATRAA